MLRCSIRDLDIKRPNFENVVDTAFTDGKRMYEGGKVVGESH